MRFLAILCALLVLTSAQTCPSPTQYYDNTTATCLECPLDGLVPQCVSANCTSPADALCYSCQPGFQLGSQGLCHRVCALPGTYYNDTTMDCSDCPVPTNCHAVTCDAPTFVICAQCEDGWLIDVSGECTGRCAPLENCNVTRCTTHTDICVTCVFPWELDEDFYCTAGGPVTCNPAQYRNDTTNTCIDCALPQNCGANQQRCTAADPTTVTCTKCATGYELDGTGACITKTCAANEYLDLKSNNCTVCPLPSNCLTQTCTSESTVTCVTCASGYVLGIDGVCSLPSGCTVSQFLDPTSNQCIDCPLPTKCTTVTCRSTTDVTCSACEALYALVANACQIIPTCTATQWYNPTSNTCVDCSPVSFCFSYSCTSSSNSACSVCNSGYIIDPVTKGCILPPSCTSLQYLDPVDSQCKACPFVGVCVSGACSSASDAICTSCGTGYKLLADGTCQVINDNSPCDLCPEAGKSAGCALGSVCCGCSTSGVGTCRTSCDESCTELICPAETGCGTPSHCQTRGGCKAITAGTCASCFIGYEGVADSAVGLFAQCSAVAYRSCDACNPDAAVCSAGESCCCGTCRAECNIRCGESDCSVRNTEQATVVTRHLAATSCDDTNSGVVEDLVRAHVYYVLGAWLQSGEGTAAFSQDCDDQGKRQSSSIITSEIVLTGINAVYQATLLQDNFPTNGTGNGVAVTLESTDGGGGSGLSGGAIAGIIIGSIVGFILVLILVYVVITKSEHRVDTV